MRYFIAQATGAEAERDMKNPLIPQILLDFRKKKETEKILPHNEETTADDKSDLAGQVPFL